MNTPRDISMERRDFLKLAGAAAVVGLTSTAFAQNKAIPPKPRMGIQMYSVRGFCKQNKLAKALEEVAKLGFEGVEFAGLWEFGGNPIALRKLLDDLGLIACGTHIGTGSLRGDALKRTIDLYQSLGCKYLIVPGDGNYWANADSCKKLAQFFTETAEKLEPLGMKTGYHNHTNEFKQFDGKHCYDIFAENSSQKVVIQQDCGWSLAAGKNPSELIRKYPGRSGSLHFKPTVVRKEAGKKAYFGNDSVNWPDVLRAAWEVGGCEWAVLEQEAYPDGKSDLDCVKISAANMKQLWDTFRL